MVKVKNRVKKFLKELNHNSLAIMFVAIAGILTYLISGSKDIQIAISEVAYQRALFLAMLTSYSFLLMKFLGGFRFSVTNSIKRDPVALAILVGSFIIGAALVIGK